MACPTQYILANAGTTSVNGSYTGPDEFDNYNLEGGAHWLNRTIAGPNAYWRVAGGGGATLYVSETFLSSETVCPDEAIWVVGSNGIVSGSGSAEAPTVTAVVTPSSPTFGLPADVVALVTSRFGTVANFLRLRNQGQV